jgi:hypothetical protein
MANGSTAVLATITLSKAAEILELDLDDMRELSNSWAE